MTCRPSTTFCTPMLQTTALVHMFRVLQKNTRKLHGHPAKDDFPEWEPCHDILMANNVMGIENLGGDLDKVTNQRFLFCAFPLRWYMGDGTIVRAVAFVPSDRVNKDVPDKVYPYGVY